jgi:hypothetical protein
MFRRVALIALVAVPCAGCGTGTTPSLAGRDPVGLQLYSIGGDRLAKLEAVANSNCPGVSRPYVKSIGGSGDDSTMTYTCE